MTSDNEGLMTADNAAKYLRVSRRTLSRYVREFGLPCLRGPGGKMYFKASDICAWLEKTTREYSEKRGVP